MFSVSKKGTQIYYPFVSKSPGKQIPSRFTNGERWREIPVYRTFLHIFLYISLSQKALRKECPSMFHKSGMATEN
jgi:hypothetical protein